MNEGYGKAAQVLMERLCDADGRGANKCLVILGDWLTVRSMEVFAAEIEREGL